MHDSLPRWFDSIFLAFQSPTVQWSLLLALAAASGPLVQRALGLPRVVGYSAVGALAGAAGFGGMAWPLHGVGLYLLELGVALVLFEAGGRVAWRWFRHNPRVLLQSLAEAVLTYAAVVAVLRALGLPSTVAEPLGAIAIVASPAVLTRVALDLRASGPVTERALALTTLGTLYALALVSARTRVMDQPQQGLADTLAPIALVLGVSAAVGALLALVLRAALRALGPSGENTAILIMCLIAAATALAGAAGGSAPLAALLGGMALKQAHPRPWSWPGQLGNAGAALVMLNLVQVAVAAAQAPWSLAVAAPVLALLAARAGAKVLGVALANPGSGLRWRQGLWTAGAMWPMSSVALLLVAQFAASPALGPPIAAVALPALLVMEVLGAIVATLALRHAGEAGRATQQEAGRG